MTTLQLADSPFQHFLRLKLERAEAGTVEIRMPFRDEFLRADGSDWLHGGVLSALIDIAGDYAVISQSGGEPVPTIDLRIDYLRPAKKGDLVATGRAVKVGRTVGIADVEVRDTKGAVVAIGRGVYATLKS